MRVLIAFSTLCLLAMSHGCSSSREVNDAKKIAVVSIRSKSLAYASLDRLASVELSGLAIEIYKVEVFEGAGHKDAKIDLGLKWTSSPPSPTWDFEGQVILFANYYDNNGKLIERRGLPRIAPSAEFAEGSIADCRRSFRVASIPFNASTFSIQYYSSSLVTPLVSLQ